MSDEGLNVLSKGICFLNTLGEAGLPQEHGLAQSIPGKGRGLWLTIYPPLFSTQPKLCRHARAELEGLPFSTDTSPAWSAPAPPYVARQKQLPLTQLFNPIISPTPPGPTIKLIDTNQINPSQASPCMLMGLINRTLRTPVLTPPSAKAAATCPGTRCWHSWVSSRHLLRFPP